MPGETLPLSMNDEARLVQAMDMANEAMRDVKDVRKAIDNIKDDLLERIRENKKGVENVRDMHLSQVAEIKKDVNDMKVSVTKSLGDIQVALNQGQVHGKWHKTLLWFIFAQIFMLIFGIIATIVTKALMQVLAN